MARNSTAVLPANRYERKQTLPRISIGIPTYNGAHRISKALNSIFEQQYGNLELIISDNASSDDTATLCERVIREHPEADIRYFRQKENVGILRNFESALMRATGTYFMWVADDDMLAPGVLLQYVRFLEEHPDYASVTGKITYWKGDDMLFDEQFTLEQDSALARVTTFYAGVRWTGMVHAFMRRELAHRVPLREIWASDYHFAAGMAFLGKMKSFDFEGYRKWLGGVSENRTKLTRSLGEAEWVAHFPRLKIAVDALREPYRSPVYSQLSFPGKLFLGLCSAMAVSYNYGVKMKAESMAALFRTIHSPAKQALSQLSGGQPTLTKAIDTDKH